MGHGLKGLPRDQVILATKVGRYDKANFDFSAATVTQSVHDSLKRLQVEYIDLIQTHDIEFGDLDQVSMPVLRLLRRLHTRTSFICYSFVVILATPSSMCLASASQQDWNWPIRVGSSPKVGTGLSCCSEHALIQLLRSHCIVSRNTPSSFDRYVHLRGSVLHCEGGE